MRINNGLYLQAYVVLTLAICGLVQYLLGIGAILWLPFLAAMAMVMLLFLQNNYESPEYDVHEMCIAVLYIGMCALVLASTFLQRGA